MADANDWQDASWAGNRLRQHRESQALPFREKLMLLEQLGEVAAFLVRRRIARGLPIRVADHDRGDPSA
jgi:hypothetical protein